MLQLVFSSYSIIEFNITYVKDSFLCVSHSFENGVVHWQNDDVDAVRPQVGWPAPSVEISDAAI